MTESENISPEDFKAPLPNSEQVEEVSPSSNSRKFLIVGLFAALLLTAGVAAYLFSQNQSLKSQLGLPTFKFPWTRVTCTYEGLTYQAGESVPSIDSCNSCSCDESGQVACTDIACDNIDKKYSENEVFFNAPVIDEKGWKSHEIDDISFALPADFLSAIAKVNNSNFPKNFSIYENEKIKSGQEECYRNNGSSACSLRSSGYILSDVLSPGIYQEKLSQHSDELNVSFIDLKGRNWQIFKSGGQLSIENVAYLENPDRSARLVILGYYPDPESEYFNITYNAIENLYSFTKTILSTFQFTKNQISENFDITFQGKLASMERPSPEINYDYQLELDTPYFDELNAQGPRNITSIVVVPENEAIRQRLASNIGNSVSIEGVIEWGLAETRHLKANKIVAAPAN